MVAGAQQQPQPHQQQQPASAEEEAVKRSTDCVYFLASPLTCKKGSECEYRHSDFARVNPRDCWYWLNSNCLNPKCAFRHPPIEGLLGTQASSSAGFTPSLSQATVAPVTSATQNSSKQVTSCIYFQKGYCMKGDRCSFLHGPNPPTSAKVAQASAAPQGSDSSNVKKVFPSLQKCSQEQKIPQENTAKSVGAPPMVNPVTKVELPPLGNGVGFERSVLPTKPFDDERLRTKAVSAHVMNGMPTNQINRSHPVILSSDHVFQNGKDADEFLRESSPGFDVLVEDELGDQEYFHGEDQYGRLRARDGRSLNVDEYDMDRSADYGSAADVDRDRFRDPRGFESHVQGQYAWEPPRALSDRKAIGAPQFDGRGYRKSNSPDNIDGTDLRHQLSKHRRVNGLQSVISHDYAHDGHNDDRNYRGSSRRDSQPIQQHKGPLSSRLRGRINFGSPTNGAKSRVDREFDRGRSRGRLSPNKSQTSTYQGRFRDRLKGGVHDSYNNEGRSGGSSRTGRDITDGGSIKFSGPKSLPELKGGKGGENKEQSILGKRKNTRTEVSQQPEGDVSFDGPKPLSEILKRKRKAEAVAASERGKSLVESQSTRSTTLDKEEGESKSASIDVVGTKDEKIEDPQGVSNEAPNNANELEAEEGMIYDETVDDQELEADDDQAHGEEYDYEQGEEEEDEEGEYDVENAEGEEEYLEDEDDDFAKKIGVLSS